MCYLHFRAERFKLSFVYVRSDSLESYKETLWVAEPIPSSPSSSVVGYKGYEIAGRSDYLLHSGLRWSERWANVAWTPHTGHRWAPPPSGLATFFFFALEFFCYVAGAFFATAHLFRWAIIWNVPGFGRHNLPQTETKPQPNSIPANQTTS